MENASRAFLDAVRTSIRQIRGVLGATTVDPLLLTAAERIQHEGYLRREETNLAILGLAKEGAAIRRSSAAPVTVAASSARSYAANTPTFSGSGSLPWSSPCRGSRRSG